ncbi:MAG: hypothetical protein OSJ68_08175, partial [Clostridia bacterium]|nr:hypothetical protein [Clostridia bacterium]
KLLNKAVCKIVVLEVLQRYLLDKKRRLDCTIGLILDEKQLLRKEKNVQSVLGIYTLGRNITY